MGKKDTCKTALFFLTHPHHLRDIGRWRKSLAPERNSINDELPWLTFGAIDWLDRTRTPHDRVFEYGSGGSTIFLARRAGEVHAVEHDRAWHKHVARALVERGIHTATLHLHEPQISEIPRHPYASTRYTGKHFENYVRTIELFPKNHFSLVIIDGRARTQCIAAALPKIARGGYLLLDNAERARYRDATNKLDATYPRTDFYGMGPYNHAPWRTSVWKIDK